MKLVTSFSSKGYAIYGRRMLVSAVFHWPGEIVVYYEEKPDLVHEKITYKPLLETYGCQNFLDYCDRSPVFHGNTEFGYNYNKDAAKFCRKVFAQFDAFKDKGKVFWVDADTIIHKPITEAFLESLFNGKSLAFAGRTGFYTETGFVGFDTEHEDFQRFLEQYTEVYRKGLIFTLERWHDCEAFDWARNESGVEGNNLSPDWRPGDKLDVLKSTPLNECLTHLKGNTKWKSKDSLVS